MTEQFANVVSPVACTLTSAITSSATTLLVSSVANLPTSFPYRIVVQDSASALPEIMLVTGAAGLALTVTRGLSGADNTPAAAHVFGATVRHVMTAQVMQDLQSQVAALSVGGGTTAWPVNIKVLNLTASAASTISINPAGMVPGAGYTLKDAGLNAGTNNITLSPTTGTINDDAAYSSRTLTFNGQAITFYSDGTNLWVKS